VVCRLITTLGAGLLWHGGWVSKRTHMAVRSAAMTSLLRWRGLRLGSEKSTISEKDQDLGGGLCCGLPRLVGSICGGGGFSSGQER